MLSRESRDLLAGIIKALQEITGSTESSPVSSKGSCHVDYLNPTNLGKAVMVKAVNDDNYHESRLIFADGDLVRFETIDRSCWRVGHRNSFGFVFLE